LPAPFRFVEEGIVSVVERARPSIARIVADLGLDLYDLDFAGGVLRVTVTRQEGIDLEAIADVTRMVSRELDHVEPMPDGYTLEVSSPGLERTLRTPDHFRGAIGSTINVRTHPEVAGERRAQGTLTAADDEGITVELDGPAMGERHLRYHDIERARTVFVWGPESAPAKQRNGAATRKAGR
jgi:ribosome maturation factor RimP